LDFLSLGVVSLGVLTAYAYSIVKEQFRFNLTALLTLLTAHKARPVYRGIVAGQTNGITHYIFLFSEITFFIDCFIQETVLKLKLLSEYACDRVCV
jgi:hypothetical protein